MKLTRRTFIKTSAAVMVYSVGGTWFIGEAEEIERNKLDPSVTWSKAVCRFCGTGCGVMVGVQNRKVVAIRGDSDSPVNKGLLCAKGYHLGEILYGQDRLTKPLIRKQGKLVPASWAEALDLVAAKFKESTEKYGPDSVAMYGSGQWTIQEGYAAAKLFKAGIGTNNIECNARLCMASAVTGFMSTFGSDEPMGCYDDLDQADVFVLWGENMAENHPVLYSRILDGKRKRPSVRIVDIAPRRTRTTESADLYAEIIPQSDLALANGIAHLIVREKLYVQDFINQHVAFKKGVENPGYGLEDKFTFDDKPQPITFDEYKNFLARYTPEYVAQLTGLSVEQIKELAKLYGDPQKKVVSLWCMGVNQHTRGTWMNNLIYNLHLLTGKICQPGSNPLSVTGQPSACGTTREVGTFSHRLPADMVVNNPDHRKKAAEIWNVPVEKIPAKPGYNTVEMFRALDRGDIKVMWIQYTNPFQSLPNLNRYTTAAQKDHAFIVVSDVYPTVTTELADVVLPSAMWVEKEGLYGNTERRTQHWEKLIEPPGEAKPDVWQIVEVAKRIGLGHLFNYPNQKLEEALFAEYRKFTLGTGKDLATYEEYKKSRGLRWPVVNSKETKYRYVEGFDPYVEKGKRISFYKNKKDGDRAIIWARPYEPAPEVPDQEFPFWLSTGRVLEHWHTGTMTRRVPQLHRAMTEAVVELHPEDADQLQIANGDRVKLVSRRGELILKAVVGGRGTPRRGSVFVPFFDQSKLVNKLTLDAYCPISKEPDFKKCAVRVEKI